MNTTLYINNSTAEIPTKEKLTSLKLCDLLIKKWTRQN